MRDLNGELDGLIFLWKELRNFGDEEVKVG